MPDSVGVVACVRNPGSRLAELVSSLDDQSLPFADFSVLVVDRNSDDGSAARLTRLAGRRPNLSVIHAPADTDPTTLLIDRLSQLDTDYAVLLTEGQTLRPHALERLRSLAGTSGAEIVVARRSTVDGSGARLRDVDPQRLTEPGPAGDDAAALVAHGSVFARRALLADALRSAGRVTPAEAIGSLVSSSPSVVVLADYVCVHDRTGAADPSSGEKPAEMTVRLDPPQIDWRDGVAGIRLTGSIDLGEIVDASAEELRPLMVVADPSTGEEFELATTAAIDASAAVGVHALTVDAALEPGTAAGGGPLADGLWQVLLRLYSLSSEIICPVPKGSAKPALIDGRPFTLGGADPVLTLDVGATAHSLVERLDVDDVDIIDDRTGSLLVAALPGLHSRGAGGLDGHLFQDGFAVPGAVTAADEGATLRCYVGGLPGRYELLARFGEGRPVSTGLDLEFSPLGSVTVADRPAPPKKAAAKKIAAKKATATKATAKKVAKPPRPLTRVEHLRRALPSAADPVIARARRIPALRTMYRRLAGR